MSETKYPKVGVGVMIQNEGGEVLLGLRHGSHGEGEWSFPGGHVDFGETLFESAVREAKEETGLEVVACELVSVSDDFRYIETSGKHYVTIGIRATYQDGTPKAIEPDRFFEWRWFDLNNLPDNLFEGTHWIIENVKHERIYSSPVL